MNHLRTFILLAAMTALFTGLGYLIGGPTGMAIAFAIAAAMNVFSYWNADRMVLGMYGAQTVDAGHPDARVRNYVADITELAARADMPTPRICIIESEQPNAFATGRDPAHATVCASTGLLTLLSRGEIRGVMAHELAHVKNRDTLTMTITATIAGAIGMLANFAMFFGGGHNDEEDRGVGLIGGIAMMILAPIAAALVQMAISRTREYEADRIGAEIAGDPNALAAALEKIEAYAHGGAVNVGAERNPATAHMFIINPLLGRGMDNLFSTHPNTANRIAALMKMAGQGRAAARAGTAVPLVSRAGPWS